MFRLPVITFLTIILSSLNLYPCTNILITKGASEDGSVMVTYSADSFELYGYLYHYPPAVYPSGTMRKIFDWDSGKYLLDIKEAGRTYNVIGNINEYQVVIAETTFGGRDELKSEKGIDYGSLMYLALQRAKSAREAIEVMIKLVEEYGYSSKGESFSIADKNEVWIMEMVGKGEEKGAVWAAIRIPDGYISAHANQARITKIPFGDKENVRLSQDVLSFAKKMGYFNGKDEDFSFADAYDPLTFKKIRVADARVWSIFQRVNKDMNKYITYIQGKTTERMPLYIKPAKKLSLKDVFELMRDHYEGTELDISQDTGAGIYKSPYRPRPLFWEYRDTEYFNERPISTYQTGFSFVSQSRSNLPDEIGGVLWFGVDDTFFTTYVPVYCSAREVPYEFSKEAGSIGRFSWESAFWAVNAVSNFVYPRYSYTYKDVKSLQSQIEGEFLSEQGLVEKKALELHKRSEYDAIEFLTEYSKKVTTKVVSAYKNLFGELMVKYVDGISKDENFKPVNIGFPDEIKERIVSKEGSRYKVRKVPGQEKTDYELYKNKLTKLLKDANIKEAEELLKKALKEFPKDEFFRKTDEKLKKIKEELKRGDK